MKTSFSIVLSLAIFCFTCVSCSKENSLVVENQNGVVENQNMVSLKAISAPQDPSIINPVNVGLEGFFKFDNNLNDNAGKLTNAIPTSSGNLTFAIDRKGVPFGSVYLDGYYGLSIANVPTNTACTIAAWVKNISVSDGMPITPNGYGLQLAKMSNTYRGIASVPNAAIMVSSNTIQFGWHLVVVTYDGATLKMYNDGQLVKSTASAYTIPSALVGYHLGQVWNGSRWRGYIDDLRFYKRALTAADVQSLYAL